MENGTEHHSAGHAHFGRVQCIPSCPSRVVADQLRDSRLEHLCCGIGQILRDTCQLGLFCYALSHCVETLAKGAFTRTRHRRDCVLLFLQTGIEDGDLAFIPLFGIWCWVQMVQAPIESSLTSSGVVSPRHFHVLVETV